MGVDILPLEIDFGSLGVDFRTLCERMFGVWETNWDLLESILALRGEFWLVRLNIGLLEMIVRLWELFFGVCGSIVSLLESILGLYESILNLWAGGRILVS